MRLFKRKFEVKIKHETDIFYSVSFTDYFLIPVWSKLRVWDRSIGSHSMTVGLFSVEEAEKVAEKIKSLEDVGSWMVKQMDKRDKHLDMMHCKIPYKSKTINIER